MQLTDYHAKYFAHELIKRCPSDSAEKLAGGLVDAQETNKSLLLKHLRDCGSEGCKFEELKQVLPMLSRYQIHSLLKELKAEKKIRVEGRTRAGKWFAEGSGEFNEETLNAILAEEEPKDG